MAQTTDPGAGGAVPERDTPGQDTAGQDTAGQDTAGQDAVMPTVLEQIGGVSGLIYSTVPVVVFVPANSLFGLRVAIISALCAALAVFGIRLWRRERLNPAVAGLIGVAICTFIAYRVGDAKGYFLFGIWTTLAYAVAFALSILLRWPLVGVAWNFVNGEGMGWRRHRRTLIAYDLATGVWALVFVARYLTQSELYDHGETGWLAVTRIAMGWPLTALAVLATIVLVRRATREEEHEQAHESVSSESLPPESLPAESPQPDQS